MRRFDLRLIPSAATLRLKGRIVILQFVAEMTGVDRCRRINITDGFGSNISAQYFPPEWTRQERPKAELIKRVRNRLFRGAKNRFQERLNFPIRQDMGVEFTVLGMT